MITCWHHVESGLQAHSTSFMHVQGVQALPLQLPTPGAGISQGSSHGQQWRQVRD
jgi:hypothetical protein